MELPEEAVAVVEGILFSMMFPCSDPKRDCERHLRMKRFNDKKREGGPEGLTKTVRLSSKFYLFYSHTQLNPFVM